MSAELKLIQEIEKHQCLYNFNSPEYSRKDLTEKAWAEVSALVELGVHDCKEKWRNIRSSLLRSMKSPRSGSRYKLKKPYYLKEDLQFVLPYVKRLNNSENPQPTTSTTENPRPTTSRTENPQPATSAEKSLPATSANSEVITVNGFDEQSQNVFDLTEDEAAPTVATTTEPRSTRPSTNQSPPNNRRRAKRPIAAAEVDRTFMDYLKTKSKRTQQIKEVPIALADHPMRYFLMSLLPEFDTMTEAQLRTFKIKSMILIDEIKSNISQIRRTSHSERSIPAFEESSSASVASPFSQNDYADTEDPIKVEEINDAEFD